MGRRMTSRSPLAARGRKARLLCACAAALAVTLIGCSPKSDAEKPNTASNVTLTDAQRQHIRMFTVASASYRKSIDTTGVVDFDNDQATSVMAPISGPVTRLFVAPGD